MDDIHNKAANSILNNQQDETLKQIFIQEQLKQNQEAKFGVENTEINFDRINLSKENIISELLNTKEKNSLVYLIKSFFKDKTNQLYTQEDLKEILKHHNQFTTVVEEKLKDKKFKVNKKGYLIFNVDNQWLVGASAINQSVWFVFTNEKLDVNNGSIYIRQSNIKTIKLISTFEINAYSAGKVVAIDEVTGKKVVKDKITFIPNWLTNTLTNMQKVILEPLFNK